MKSHPSVPLSCPAHPAAAWCDGGIEVVLTGLLVLMPFALGVVAPWSEAVVVGAVALVAAALALRACFHRGRDVVLSWAVLPVGLFLAIAAAQLLPLPAAVAGAISPHTLATRTRLLGDLPDAAAVLGKMTLSFYPAATRHDLRLVLAFAVVFLATIQVYRRESQQRRLLWAIVLSGGAAAVLALLQDLSGADKIYWRIPTPRAFANSGPFIAYSNYSQYVNLCIGAALGLLLYALRRDTVGRAGRWSERAGRSERSGETSRRRSSRRSREVAASGEIKSSWHVQGLKSWRAAGLLAVMVLGCVTLFLSLSRGGMLALLCATVLTWLMLARRRGTRGAGWLLTVVLLVAFGALLYSGSDAVFERLATLKTARDPSAGRFQTYKDILLAWRQFPLLGTGLGTHEYVYSMFDRSSDPAVAEFADSDYFQVLEEMGALGLALVLVFAACVWRWYFRAVRRGGGRIDVVAYGLGFGLAAVMLQSFTDFGQHLPAIGCVSAVFCGLLFNLASNARRGEAAALAVEAAADAASGPAPAGEEAAAIESAAAPAPRADVFAQGADVSAPPARARRLPAREWPGSALLRHPSVGLAVSCALIVAMGWAFVGADAARRARAASDRAAEKAQRLESLGWRAGDADFDDLIATAAAAVAEEPDDVKSRYLLACYRWRAVSRPGGAEVGGGAAKATLSAEKARQVVDELNRARAVCPTYGPTFAVAGQIERLVLGQPIGSEHVRTAYALAPANPDVCLAAAQLALAEGALDESLRKARRCSALDPDYVEQVTDLYLRGADRPDLAVTAVSDDPDRLCRVYYELRDAGEEGDDPRTTVALASARGLLKTARKRPDVSPWTLVSLANILADQKEYAASADYYRRALQKEYGQADWHLGLANVLARCGQSEEANHQAQISLHLQPQLAGARDLIREINSRPAPLVGAASPAELVPAEPGDSPQGSASGEERPQE